MHACAWIACVVMPNLFDVMEAPRTRPRWDAAANYHAQGALLATTLGKVNAGQLA
jgi:hypothetical protein